MEVIWQIFIGNYEELNPLIGYEECLNNENLKEHYEYNGETRGQYQRKQIKDLKVSSW